LPNGAIRLDPRRVIKLIGGPGKAKSVFSSAIIVYQRLHHKAVALFAHPANSLVWQKDYEEACDTVTRRRALPRGRGNARGAS